MIIIKIKSFTIVLSTHKYSTIGGIYYLTKLIENVLIVSICMETSDIYYNILYLKST